MIFSLIFSAICFAKLVAVATTPDVAWLVKQIGGDEVDVQALARPNDNYHLVEARPDFVLKLARADIFCQVGAELEIAWAPKILEKAANPKLLSGVGGECDLSKAVTLIEKPTAKIDRSMGDSHAAGNPHYWLSPVEMKRAAQIIQERLISLAPEHKEKFLENHKKTTVSLESTFQSVKAMLSPISGKTFIQYHKEFSYFASAYGLKIVGTIEEIPGVSPSASRIATAAADAKKESAHLILASSANPIAILKKFSEASGIKFVALPISLEGFEANAYDRWQKQIVEKILSP